MVLRIDTCRGVAALRRLERDWMDLWRSDPRATAFQSPRWLIPWAETFQPERCLAVAARREGRLVALLPLFLIGDQLMLLGAGTSDWLDVLVNPEFDRGDVAGMVAAAADIDGWSRLEFVQVPPDSPLNHVTFPWATDRVAGEDCPGMVLPPSFPARLAGNLRAASRRLDREGPWRVTAVGASAALDALDELASWQVARWGAMGVLRDPAALAFHHHAVPGLERAGLLRMFILEQSGSRLAVLYGFADRGRFRLYLTGFDPMAARFSPGSVLLARTITELADEGLTWFDFLRGREQYKYAFGGHDQRSVIIRAKRS